METDWGDVGTWVAGLATLGGLVYAAQSLKGQTKQHEAEDKDRRDVERRLLHQQQIQARRALKKVDFAPRIYPPLDMSSAEYEADIEIHNGCSDSLFGVSVFISQGDDNFLEVPIPDLHEGARFSSKASNEVQDLGLRWTPEKGSIDGDEEEESSYIVLTDIYGYRWKVFRDKRVEHLGEDHAESGSSSVMASLSP